MKIFIFGGSGYLGRSLISGLGKKYKISISSRHKKINIKNSELLNENKDKKKIIQRLKESDLILIANGPSYKDSPGNLFSYIKYLNHQTDLISRIKKKKKK